MMKKTKKIILTMLFIVGFSMIFMTSKTFAMNLAPRMSLSIDTDKVTCNLVDFNGIKEVTVNGKKQKVETKETRGSNKNVVRAAFTISEEGDFEIKVSDGTKGTAKTLKETITIKKDAETGAFSVNRAPRIKVSGSKANQGQRYSGDETITITDYHKFESIRIYEYVKDSKGKAKYVDTTTAASVIEYKMQYKKSSESDDKLVDVDKITDASVVTIKFRPQSKQSKYKIEAVDGTGKIRTRIFTTTIDSVKNKEYNYNYEWNDTFIEEKEKYNYDVQYVPGISLDLTNEENFIMKNKYDSVTLPLTKVALSKKINGKWNSLATYMSEFANKEMKIGASKLLQKGKSGIFRITATGPEGSTAKKIIQLKRLEKASGGKYFSINNSPRLTYKVSDKTKFSATAKDNSGLKSITIEAATEKSGKYDKTLLNVTSKDLKNKKEDTVTVDLASIDKIGENYEIRVTAVDDKDMTSVETFKVVPLNVSVNDPTPNEPEQDDQTQDEQIQDDPEQDPAQDPEQEQDPAQDPEQEQDPAQDPEQEQDPAQDPEQEQDPAQDPEQEQDPAQDPEQEQDPAQDPEQEQDPTQEPEQDPTQNEPETKSYKLSMEARAPTINLNIKTKNEFSMIVKSDAGIEYVKVEKYDKAKNKYVDVKDLGLGSNLDFNGKTSDVEKTLKVGSKKIDKFLKKSEGKVQFRLTAKSYNGRVLKRVLKIERLSKADSEGKYFNLNNSPRINYVLPAEGKTLGLEVTDYSKLQKIEVTAKDSKKLEYSDNIFSKTYKSSKIDAKYTQKVDLSKADVIDGYIYLRVKITDKTNMIRTETIKLKYAES